MKELIGLLTVAILASTLFYFIGLIWWKIFAKAGYNGALGLLLFVPLVNVIMLCILAFQEWPIERELAHVKRLLPPQRRTVFDKEKS